MSGSTEDGEPLGAAECTRYRSLVARANYLAQDRMDIQYSVKELTRRMSAPDSKDYEALKRLGRYFVGRPRVIINFDNQNRPKHLDCWVDTDWAGCVRTRRSTSGGGMQWGSHSLNTWATTQATVALSSGEAEYYGVVIVKGASHVLGLSALLADFGIKVRCRVHTDSTAAKGIASRTGLGRTRHIAVHLLWVQERIRNKDFELLKCKGTENPADLMTKHLDQTAVEKYAAQWGLLVRSGRSPVAPHIV